MAAVWDSWQSEEGDIIQSCCLVTTSANLFMSQIHDRMPVLLSKERQRVWMDNSHCQVDVLQNLLNPYERNDLIGFPVTSKMNNARFNSPEAIVPIVGTSKDIFN